MKTDKREKLDNEQKSRIMDIAHEFDNHGKLIVSEVFLSPPVSTSVQAKKILIETFDLQRILSNYPFSSTLYVIICPRCSCVLDSKDLEILLHHQAIIPILIGNYSQYPNHFVDLLLNYPHISRHEFRFYRYARLVSQTNSVLCHHCVKEKREEIFAILDEKNILPKAHRTVEDFLGNLYPFIDPDMHLIDNFYSALKNGKFTLASQIFDLSRALRDARTIQAYNSITALPMNEFPRLLKKTDQAIEEFSRNTLTDVNNAITKALHLSIPSSISIEKYLSVLEPYRKELSGVIQSVHEKSQKNGRLSITKLVARIEEINYNLLMLPKKKRFLVYRSSVSFIKANKAIIASSLLASVFGLTGNFVGCGLSAISGIGAEILKRKSSVKLPREVHQLGEEVYHTIRPPLNKLIAKYLHLDIDAVQLWEIRENLNTADEKSEVRKLK